MFIEFFKYLSMKVTGVQDFILWSFIFGMMHTMFSPSRNRDIFAYLFSMLVSVPVGVLAGLVSNEYLLTESVTYIVVSVSALVAQDIVRFILGIAGFLNKNRDSLLGAILDYTKKRFLSQPDKTHEDSSSK